MSQDEEHEEENKENESFQCRLPDKWWIDADCEVNKAVWVRFKSSTPEESSSVQKQNSWLSFLLSSSELFTTFGLFNDLEPAELGSSLSWSD